MKRLITILNFLSLIVSAGATNYHPDPSETTFFNNTPLMIDTVYLDHDKNWAGLEITNWVGQSQLHPIKVMGWGGSLGSPVFIGHNILDYSTARFGMIITNCKYVDFDGTNTWGDYLGFKLRGAPEGIASLSAFGFWLTHCSNVTIQYWDIGYLSIGVHDGVDPNCDTMQNHPNYINDSIIVDHCRIHHCWNQGIYAGNTNPNNCHPCGPGFVERPVVCDGITYYYQAARDGYHRISNCFISYTGRPGIQLSAAWGGPESDIYNDTVKYCGLNDDPAQGNGISLGVFTRAYVRNNLIVNTLRCPMVSLGASGTCASGFSFRFVNNHIDSGNKLRPFDFSTTTWVIDGVPDRFFYRYDTMPTKANVYNDQTSYDILVETKLHVDPNDSTNYLIKDNTSEHSLNVGLIIADGQGTTKKAPHSNFICNNISLDLAALMPIIQINGASVPYDITGCGNTAPSADAGIDQTITLPTNSVTVSGSGVDIDGTIVSYAWSKISGPSTYTIISPSLASTVINTLVQGTYVFRLTVTDDLDATGSDDIIVVVNPAIVPGGSRLFKSGKFNKRKE